MHLDHVKLVVGFVCVLSVSSLSAQDTPAGQAAPVRAERRGGNAPSPFFTSRQSTTSTTSLTNIPKVPEELGLTAEQKQQIDELRRLNTEKQQQIVVEFQKRATELNRETEEAANKLLDEKQRTRLDQLRLQREGLVALSKPEMQEKLGLTAEQIEKLTPLTAQYRRTPAFVNSPDPGSGERNRSSRRRPMPTREQLATDITAVLTPMQKAKWDELLGAAFQFPANPSRFGRENATIPLASRISARSKVFELGQYPLSNDAFLRSLNLTRNMTGSIGLFRYRMIVDGLKLSEEQSNQIREIGVEDTKAISHLSAVPETERSTKFTEINKTTQEKLDKVLTDEQKAKLKELAPE